MCKRKNIIIFNQIIINKNDVWWKQELRSRHIYGRSLKAGADGGMRLRQIASRDVRLHEK
jgi:hypothetical protein